MIHLKSVNELTLCAECDGMGELFTKTGAMIGFYGDCKFDKVMLVIYVCNVKNSIEHMSLYHSKYRRMPYCLGYMEN